MTRSTTPVPLVRIEQATLRYGARTLWDALDVEVAAGEFVAVLGPNGAGKTTLLQVLLGLNVVSQGRVEVLGEAPRRGNDRIGYVPQQKAFDRDLAVRGRDRVRFGLDGHRPGLALRGGSAARRVDKALELVEASGFAEAAIGRMSGGEQQRLRIAQALVGDPDLLLCDEPLLSLDLHHQEAMSRLIHERCRKEGTGVLFVTHDINPILDYVDRVLYLAEGRFAIGAPREVMTSEQLSRLYGTAVDVLDVRGRIVVIGSHDAAMEHGHGHHHDAAPQPRASAKAPR
jgi:zinc/manganese transport system ATP-binding protein